METGTTLVASYIVSYNYTCTNGTKYLANLQDLIPTLTDITVSNINHPKYGVKSSSCRFAIECVLLVYAWM